MTLPSRPGELSLHAPPGEAGVPVSPGALTIPSRPGALSIQGIDVHAGGLQLLHGVSFRLFPGQLCALIGPSGAGKSTLIKVLLGLRRPQAGQVSLDGRPLQEAGPVGYVPQDDALHRSLSVRRALDFAMQLRLPDLDEAARARRLETVCRQVGLEERLDTRISRLSGGQRKRVSVAMELLTSPSLLILDEPTSGLDPGLEARMMALFQEVARSGRMVLVATHAMESLSRCDRLVVLTKGHLVYAGTPAGALEFFRTDRFAGIFQQLEKQPPAAWARAYARSGPGVTANAAPETRGPVGGTGSAVLEAGVPACGANQATLEQGGSAPSTDGAANGAPGASPATRRSDGTSSRPDLEAQLEALKAQYRREKS